MPNREGKVSTNDNKSTLSVTDTDIETVVDFFKNWINSSELKINNPEITLSDTIIELNNYSQYSGIMIGIGQSSINDVSMQGMAFVYNTKQFLIYDDKIYTRNYISNNGWSSWAEVVTDANLETKASDLGFIKKEQTNSTLASMGLLDIIYPVGSVYMSFDDTESPATLFGGYWEELPKGYFLRTGEVGTDLSIDGSDTVTLTIDMMPSHAGHLQVNQGLPSIGDASTYYLNGNVAGGQYGETPRGWNFSSGNELYPAGVSRGNGQPFSIVPKYQEVYMWKRVEEAASNE